MSARRDLFGRPGSVSLYSATAVTCPGAEMLRVNFEPWFAVAYRPVDPAEAVARG
jgi:hypothetical protein